MKARTNDFKEAIKGLKEISSKITYTINGVATELGDEELNSVQPHYQGSLLKSIMKELDLDSNVDIPKETIINYQFGVLVNGSYEYINYGNYVVYSSEKQEDTNSYLIKCYDKMLYSMVDYESFATYPITIRDYLDALCTHLGLVFKNKNDYFTNYDKTIENELYLDENGNSLGYKFRDVLDELAQVTGSIICINEEDDELEIRYPNNADATRTSVSGTNLILNNVDDIKVDDITLTGETTQASTPTPSSPQEVVNVTGRQEIKAVGKNLFNKDTENYKKGYYLNSSGVETSGTNWGIYYIPVQSNTAYTISGCTTNTGVYFWWLDSRKNALTLIGSKKNYTNITSPNNAKYIGLSIVWNTTSSAYDETTFMLEQNSSATEYEPYKEQVNEINLGKNLYYIAPQTLNGITLSYASDGAIVLNGTSNASFTAFRSNVNLNGNYTISVSNEIAQSSTYVRTRNSSNTIVHNIQLNNTNKKTSTMNNQISLLEITIGASGIEYNNFKIYVQLEKGTQATSYSEYFTPIELCKIGNYEDKIFKTTGKNLFDKSNINLIADSYVDGSGNIVYGANNKFNWVKLAPSTTYTLSQTITSNVNIRVGLFSTTPARNVTGTVLGTFSNGNPITQTFTTTSTSIYLGWVYCNTGNLNNHTEQQMLDSIMIEKSSSATDYEPYGYNEWYIKKNIGKVVLNGSEFWAKRTDISGLTNTSCFRGSYSDEVNNNALQNTPQISNYFTCLNNTTDVEHIRYTGTTNYRFQVFINKSRLTTDDATGFKSWLSTNNTIVYYVLATPTYTKLNDALQEQLNNIYLLEGLNNVISSVPINLNYVSDIDTIDEEYFDEDNVNFGEVYGPVNTIILSRSAESDELAKSIPGIVNDEDKIAIKISDNQILNFDDREEYLDGLLNRLSGLSYVQNDYSSKGICFYELGDRYKAYIFGKYYRCLMLNDDVTIESGLKENVTTEIPETAETDYSKTSTSDKTIRRTTLIVDKQLGEIRGEVEDLQTSINGDNGLATRMTRAETKLNSQEATLTFIEENTLNEDGSVKAVSTSTNYKFDADGMKIGKSTDDFNSLQDNTGTFYYEKDTMTGKYTKDGGVFKDLGLYGKYYYGIDAENFDVATFTRDDALFLAQMYTDSEGEECFGHFYNGN